MSCLWNINDFCLATKGRIFGDSSNDVNGISVDSRSIIAGDAFFAIPGKRFDGHDYISTAIMKKASLIVACEKRLSALGHVKVPVIIVDDVFAALNRLAVAARIRSKAKIIAITGSVGKTTTKEMFRHALSSIGKTHVPINSYNNFLGVPLTLARMPVDTDFGVFEIGMNHPGEIRSLVKLVRPHIAVITNVGNAHLGNFSGIDEIAAAKAEIFEGLEKQGSVVLNHDNDYFLFLKQVALSSGIRKIYSFGQNPNSDFRLIKFERKIDHSKIITMVQDLLVDVEIGAPGFHMVENALATLGTISLLKVDMKKPIESLSTFKPARGRGFRYKLALETGYFTLIDESYNASPVSMDSAISLLAETPLEKEGRHIAVLGDMCELGPMEKKVHSDLSKSLIASGISYIWLSGINMMALKEALSGENTHVQYFAHIDELIDFIVSSLRTGDVMMIKSSKDTGFSRIVEVLLKKFKPFLQDT